MRTVTAATILLMFCLSEILGCDLMNYWASCMQNLYNSVYPIVEAPVVGAMYAFKALEIYVFVNAERSWCDNTPTLDCRDCVQESSQDSPDDEWFDACEGLCEKWCWYARSTRQCIPAKEKTISWHRARQRSQHIRSRIRAEHIDSVHRGTYATQRQHMHHGICRKQTTRLGNDKLQGSSWNQAGEYAEMLQCNLQRISLTIPHDRDLPQHGVAAADGNCVWRSVAKSTGHTRWQQLRKQTLRHLRHALPLEYPRSKTALGTWADLRAIIQITLLIDSPVEIWEEHAPRCYEVIRIAGTGHTNEPIVLHARKGHCSPWPRMQGVDTWRAGCRTCLSKTLHTSWGGMVKQDKYMGIMSDAFGKCNEHPDILSL